jgi:hypothetical protein
MVVENILTKRDRKIKIVLIFRHNFQAGLQVGRNFKYGRFV